MKIASTVRTLLLAASLVFPTYGIAETAADYNSRGIAKVGKGDFDGVIAASIAAGMPLGSEGNAQPASGACAIALPASAPARIVAENSVRSIFSPS
jgi:hypothetical protein